MTPCSDRTMFLLHSAGAARGRPLLPLSGSGSQIKRSTRWLSPTRSLFWTIPAAAVLSGALVVAGNGGPRPSPRPDAPTQVAVLASVAPAAASADGHRIGGSVTETHAAPKEAEASLPRAIGAMDLPTARGHQAGAGKAVGEVTEAADVLQAGTASVSESLPESRAGDLSIEDVEIYFKRGEEKLQAGEVAAARLYLARILRNGDRRGAVGMAWTFDPEVLAGLPVIDRDGNPDLAETWYERAGVKHTP